MFAYNTYESQYSKLSTEKNPFEEAFKECNSQVEVVIFSDYILEDGFYKPYCQKMKINENDQFGSEHEQSIQKQQLKRNKKHTLEKGENLLGKEEPDEKLAEKRAKNNNSAMKYRRKKMDNEIEALEEIVRLSNENQHLKEKIIKLEVMFEIQEKDYRDLLKTVQTKTS